MMRPVLFLAALPLIFIAASAEAQLSGTFGGPVLLPQGRGTVESGRNPTSNDHPNAYRFEPRRSATVAPNDPRLREAESWHRKIFARRPDNREFAGWSQHFSQNGSVYELVAAMLASEECFERTGGNFQDWFASSGEITGRPLTSYEISEWSKVYRQNPDRLPLARRLLDVSGHFGPLVDHTVQRPDPRAGVPSLTLGGEHPLDDHFADHDHDYAHRHYGELAPRPEYGSNGNRSGSSGRFDAAYQHSAGYMAGPRPVSPPEQIANWYRTFNGREIQPHELGKWMSDLEKGMSLDEVYASVLGGDEWYIRTGSSLPNWTASTLQALGQQADDDAMNFWLERFQRHRGDRYGTALEMVRVSSNGPKVVDWRGDERSRRDRQDRHDDDD